MVSFKLREVDGEFKAAQPWYDYLACSAYVIKHGCTLGQAQIDLFPVEKAKKGKS